MSDTARIVFTPSGKSGSFQIGTPILTAARRLGVDLDSVCGGRGICGRCQCLVSEGEFSKFSLVSDPSHISQWSEPEEAYRKQTRGGMKPNRRLGCHARLLGDLVIDIPSDSQLHRQVVRKAASNIPVEIDPTVRLYMIEVAEPQMEIPSGDLQRVLHALKEQWSVAPLHTDLSVIQGLQKALRAGNWRITCAVHNDTELIAVWSGLQPTAYGIAIDVGSTTIAAHLCDLSTGDVLSSAGVMNPQIRFGEDLMSRVSYVQMNPGGDAEMTTAVQAALNELCLETCHTAEISPDAVLEVTLVGNPVMHHLVFGIDPIELGGAPFALATNQSLSCKGCDIGLSLNAGTRIYALPCIAGHVGADAAAATLAQAPYDSKDMTLVVDVGTNAEIVLGNKDRLLACSSPTGPAFEGAQISCGQRAAPGAIERIEIDPETLEPRFKVIGANIWSDHKGFEKATRRIGVTGLCGSGIIEAIAHMYLAGLIRPDGIIDGSKASPRLQKVGRTWDYILYSPPNISNQDISESSEDAPQRGERLEIRITQADIRAIQLAKAALYAGIRLLMDHMKINHVDKIVLAGAFGSHIDPKYAMVLGMIPDCSLEAVHAPGNLAGEGARIALLNKQRRQEITDIVTWIEKIETAIEADFQAHFISAIALPHEVDTFFELAKCVDLPAKSAQRDSLSEPQTATTSRRRRRSER